MTLFEQLTRLIQSHMTVSATRHLCFQGDLDRLPVSSNILSEVCSCENVSSTRPLRNYLDDRKRNVLVLLICHGDQQYGFYIERKGQESTCSPIPDNWWQVTNHDVYLYAYACHSATFLKSSDIKRFLVNCIGYRGDLWFWFGSESAIAFWSDFFTRLCKLLKKQERIDLEVTTKIRELYNDFLKENLRKKAAGITAEEIRLNLACLNYHLEDLQFIPGARLWTDM